MNKFRLIFYAALILIFAILAIFTNLNHQILLAIAIILLFLILFTYVFRTEGTKALNVGIILCAFIALPLFILYYLGILDSFSSPVGGIIVTIIFAIVGILAIVTIMKLNFVEIEYEEK